MLLPGLDHFVPDLILGLACRELEIRPFPVRGMADLVAACAWADDPARDAIWFEFCWPPFPAMIAAHDFAGRRVVMRLHRIEAYEARHAANAPWGKIDDAIVVSAHMAQVLRGEVPALERGTALHVVHNGVDTQRFVEHPQPHDEFRIGWCGSLVLRKNPNLALEILHLLRQEDRRWHMHLCAKGGDRMAIDSFLHLRRRLGLEDAAILDGNVAAAEMPAWHARNAALLSTSVHESFGYAIAEAASCGCDVVMLDQIGAEEFWPEEMRFGTAPEAAAMLRTASRGRWRALVESRFSLPRQIGRLRELLLQPQRRPPVLRIGAGDEVLDLLPLAAERVLLERRQPDEMQAAAFLLEASGFVQVSASGDGILYGSGA